MKKSKKKNDPVKTTASIAIGGRKQKRKESRKQKKELKQAFYLKKFHKSDPVSEMAKEPNQKLAKSSSTPIKKVDSLVKLKSQAETKRKKMLKRANKEEDVTIQKLEKQLNIKSHGKKGEKEKKSLSSSIPKSFMDDGLGYILELCDGRRKEVAENIDNLSGSENEGDITNDYDDIGEAEAFPSENSDSNEDSDSENEDSHTDSDEDDMKGDEDNESHDDETDESDNDENEANESVEKDKSETEIETWEDIYGRKRDSQGNVLATKYVPPAMRAQSEKGDLSRLEKQLKGQLNRLAESNMQGIARFVEDLYSKNSRNNMNATLFTLLKTAIVLEKAMTPERLVLEHAALVALLHANVGIEVGANITQKWVDSFMVEYRSCQEKSSKMKEELEDENSKELDNMLYFICALYSFRVISHELIFDIFFMLADKFGIKDIELISLGLRCVGFNLRKDEPSRLKNLIGEIQKKAAESGSSESMRVKFMLESLMAIKNNNVKKLPNYDPTYLQHLQKIIRNFYRPSANATPLNVRLEDILQAETRGKWWIVGSAWTGRTETENHKENDENLDYLKQTSSFSEELVALAKKMRMNTDSRKVIFCAVMSSSDYMEAFEKLVKLDMKSPMKERETAFVLTICCIKEPQINPFYPKVAAKLCRQDRKFRMSVQCSIWDRLSGLVEGKGNRQACLNLANFTAVLIQDGVLSLSCLKRVEFADMNKELTLFMRTLMRALLAAPNEEKRNSYFAFISSNPKFSSLRESLKLFLHHFFRKEEASFRARIERAIEVMSSTKKSQ